MSSEIKRQYKKSSIVIKKYLGNNRKGNSEKLITKAEFEKFIKYYMKQNKKRVINNEKNEKKALKEQIRIEKKEEKNRIMNNARELSKKLTLSEKENMVKKKYNNLLKNSIDENEAIKEIMKELKLTDYTKMIIQGINENNTKKVETNIEVAALVEKFENL